MKRKSATAKQAEAQRRYRLKRPQRSGSGLTEPTRVIHGEGLANRPDPE
jgi:hypothetical protein